MVFMFVVIAGAAILGAIGLAALYDYRARRRGYRISASTDAALDNRLEVGLRAGQDSITDRRRD
jgi:hypothetical protein